MTHSALQRDYSARHGLLVEVAASMEKYLVDVLRGLEHIDRIAARAKSVDRFCAKATKQDKEGGPKYADPLTQIQDQIGARVIVFYTTDVAGVADCLQKYLRPVERREVVPESEWEFGYFGQHFVMALPDDVVPASAPRESVPRFFELQVKTLFQHAWSEANHDLCYKPGSSLSQDQTRRFAFTAAQAWGADRAFADLNRELGAQPEDAGASPN